MNSAFTKERRQDSFQGVHQRAPRLLAFYVWGYGRETPLLWHGHRVGLVGTGVKQSDPADHSSLPSAPSASSSKKLVAAEKLVAERFPLMPSYVGITAVYLR